MMNAYNDEDENDMAALSPKPDGGALETTGQFLIDRLGDFERSIENLTDAREFEGHVAPALARFRAALTRQAEPVAWQWRYRTAGDTEWSDWNDGRAPDWPSEHYLETDERPLFASPWGVPEGWRTMDSAPKDGRSLWLFWPDRLTDDRQCVGHWGRDNDGERWIDHADSCDFDEPTRWRELPAEPLDAASQGGPA